MINLVINNKKNILSSLLSLLLVGCIDTSSSFKPYSQQPINYDNTKYISSSTGAIFIANARKKQLNPVMH
ncbi:channel-forming component of a multidrug resistance efflux pump [Proteus vulgaris]|nr:channel-forming component of a multidrug resistance efflux pump [Proteus vulgaris]